MRYRIRMPVLLLLVVLQVLLATLGCTGNPPTPFHQREMLDLTHPFDASTIYWPTGDGFELSEGFKGVTEAGFYYEANSFSAPEHGGTHLDAPVHFAQAKRSVEAIPLADLIGPAVVIDVSAKALQERDYRARVRDIESWEAQHGRIVLFDAQTQ